MMKKEDKKALVAALMKQKKISAKKAQEELESAEWNIDKILVPKSSSLFDEVIGTPKEKLKHKRRKEPLESNLSTSKQIKRKKNRNHQVGEESQPGKISESQETIRKRVSREDYNDFAYYLERDREQWNKSIDDINQIEIGTGFYTMKEIVKATQGMRHHVLSPEEEALKTFNKKNKSSYADWKEVSIRWKFKNEEELLKWEPFILWFYWVQSNDPSMLSKKTYKALKDHFLIWHAIGDAKPASLVD